ncbi:MAG TPA: FAD-dependent oxidoreductase, partial [Terriglobus sp.]
MAQQHFDVVIIGSGQGGNPLAKATAKHGWKTAVIERRYPGGTCVNDGCTPSKTVDASARVAYLARRGADFGVHTGNITIDLAKVYERKQNLL